ncbi:MAG: hypothetical protein AB8F78_05015 [Saprospiraceae bacterium]
MSDKTKDTELQDSRAKLEKLYADLQEGGMDRVSFVDAVGLLVLMHHRTNDEIDRLGEALEHAQKRITELDTRLANQK